MRTALTLFACLGLIILTLTEFPSHSHASLQTQSAAPKKRMRSRFRPGEVLVRYRTESMAQARTGKNIVTAPTGELVAADVERFDGADLISGLRLVRVAPDQTLAAVAALRRQPDVVYAEPNYILKADAVPNDQFLNQQYGPQLIGAPSAWDVTTGSSNIVVGVIDQGIDLTHQDLSANIWTNPSPGSVAGISGDLHGYNFVDNTGTIFSNTDQETHATHVAGIIGARGNNTIGIAGINWSVGLMSLKFLDADGFGDTADAIRACNYAKQMRDLWVSQGPAKGANVRVLNASFGGGAFSQSFLDAINALNTSGILFVSAAGNIDNGTIEPDNDLVPHFPSSFGAPNIISVAATSSTDQLASFSHFGKTTVDLGAPGLDILSTTPPCSDPGPFPSHPCDPDLPLPLNPTQDTYSRFSGTSMAAPHVSGSAALLWAQNPNLTVQQVKNLLLFNGDVAPSLTDKTLTGRRVNVGKSFQSLQENDNTPPGSVANLHLNFQRGRAINLGWTSSGDDGAGGGAASLYELDFVDATSGAIIPLKGVVPSNPGTAQDVQVSIPFRHRSGSIRVREFDNKGNEGASVDLPVSIPPLDADPYVISEGPAAPLTSDTSHRLDINGDDRYVDFLLPNGFSFPFFGTTYTALTISSNGNLFFSDPPRRQGLGAGNLDDADDPPGSPRALGGYQMIAGLWEDLDLSDSKRADAGVYIVQPSASQLIFRWQGVPCNFNGSVCTGGAPVNFEIELRTDGTIKTRYGSGNTSLFPTVGLGGGEPEAYVVASHTSEETPLSLTNAGEVTFAPTAPWIATVLTGPQVDMKSWKVDGRTFVYAKLTFPDAGYRVTDWGIPTQAGNAFTVNATVEKSNGASAQAISSTAQIWDLGALAAGDYTFTFKTSGTTVETLSFTVSATAPPPNPIDDPREFVRWQYKDFLRREPDLPGWDHWTAEITMCSDAANRRPGETEAQCVDRKRENTSAAFFVSPEFQNTGYFVLRVYRGSLGRMPHFGGTGSPNDEFTRDAATVGQGIVVNDALAPDVINANKQAFVVAFVQRPEFRAIYDGMSNTQYVDALFQTTGVTPSASERQALIDGLNASTETKATVLFKVVDGTTTGTGGLLTFNTTYGKAFYDNLFNQAFVQMEYFGYLLRDPDPGGYAFWLGKLNTFGDWVNAEMVKAFIKSPEYRSRFGQP
ncbi:MAG TPA: S8 family serine peptidase [Pyrinomonadaceae bacterium]|jgi:subtilisin family serine protease